MLVLRWCYIMREMISKYGSDCFTRDEGGNGRTFVPGLVCLAWYYYRTFGIEGSEKLRQECETETLILFEVYLSSLYPAYNH